METAIGVIVSILAGIPYLFLVTCVAGGFIYSNNDTFQNYLDKHRFFRDGCVAAVAKLLFWAAMVLAALVLALPATLACVVHELAGPSRTAYCGLDVSEGSCCGLKVGNIFGRRSKPAADVELGQIRPPPPYVAVPVPCVPVAVPSNAVVARGP